MTLSRLKNYSRYVSLMKIILPVGIVLSVGFAILWPYLLSLDKEKVAEVNTSHPEIQENRMIHPRYLSTDKKGQPFQIDAEWAKKQADNISNLISPTGSLTMTQGETFNLKATEGHYDSQTKILKLEGNVTLKSTDGYNVQTEKARVAVDDKIIEGDTYVEGDGPTGKIMGENGFKITTLPEGKKRILLKGHSRVEITQVKMKKSKEPHVQ